MVDYTLNKKQASKSAKRKPEGDSVVIYRRLLKYAKPYWSLLIVAFVANMLYSVIDSTFAYLLKPLINKGFVEPDVLFLKWIPIIIIALFVARAIANLAGNYFMAKIARHVVLIFRQEIFKKLLTLPCEYYDRSSSGQLLSMILYNSTQVASACTEALTVVVQSGCLAIGLLVVMFSISWQLTLVFFITVPVIASVIKVTGKRLRMLNWWAQQTMGDIAHTAEEAIEGYQVVRMFGGEQYELQKFSGVTESNVFRELKIVVTKSLSVSGVQLIAICGLATMIFIGTAATYQGMTAGGFTALLAAMMALLKPMKDLTTVNSTIQRGLAGAESIFQLLDERSENDQGYIEQERVQGEISFNHVSFAYKNMDKTVLHDIHFQVQPGELVAIVGRSGSGKSTLVKLLPRFYDLHEGTITIDGHPIFEYRLASLRRQFAMVSQQVTLFNDTIANNIAYGRLGEAVSMQDIEKAAEAAHVMEFVSRLPEGLQTTIGENGVLLSGGQRQRIAIARAILKDAPIFILDEATSALDTESEKLIQNALDNIMQTRTTLVIAHRLSTIENADKIIVMDNGYIVEQGTHQALLALKGYYYKLHRMQFKQ
jgi:ATP-binding cassette, subfamily B, bacterial MsbA